MKGLIIKEAWIDLILDGRKTWEIRGRQTNKREKIGIIQSGTGTVIGTVDLVDCIALYNGMYYEGWDKHYYGPKALSHLLPYKKTYAWVFANAVRFDKPEPYVHPKGAIIWVDLDKAQA